jgi:hypothetical protein
MYPDGTPLASKSVQFSLLSATTGKPVSVFDAVSGEYVSARVSSAATNSSGEFSLSLWPNNRGQSPTVYKVTIPELTTPPFYILITEGTGSITLAQARANVAAMTPQDFTDLQMWVTMAEGFANAAAASAQQTGVEIVVPLGNVSGTQALNLSAGTIFTATATGNCIWSFTNPVNGITGVTLQITNGGLIGQMFPGVVFPSGVLPTLTATGTDILEFFSLDNWTTISGCIAQRDIR